MYNFDIANHRSRYVSRHGIVSILFMSDLSFQIESAAIIVTENDVKNDGYYYYDDALEWYDRAVHGGIVFG